MTTSQPPDQRQRDLAVDPGLSVHLEAPAGSGKTTVLMKRFLILLARVQEPEEILALTFTRKAAGELRSRLQGGLLGRMDPELPAAAGGRNTPMPPPGGGQDDPHEAELQELGRQAARRHLDKDGVLFLERLQVSTFHSFCAQLLRLLPHASSLPLDFGLLEEHDADLLQQEAVERLRRELATRPGGDPLRQALVRRLVRLNNSWPRLAAELRGLLARRDILGVFITLARQSRDPGAYESALKEHLETMLRPGLGRLAQEFRQGDIGRLWPELHRYLAASGSELAETLPAIVPGTELADLLAWRTLAQALLTKQGKCYKSFTGKFPKNFKASPWCELLQKLPSALVEELNRYRELPAIFLQGDEVEAVQDLIILLNQALTTYESLCRSRRCLDFIGLEQAALQMLENEDLPELFGRLDRRLTHLLVDEFQDTSVNQMNLLCRLLGAWQGEPGRSLMVVGDPKQSIYGWRQARVELFTKARAVGRLPCPEAPRFDILTLETNFRSTQALIDWTNAVFGATVMPDQEVCGVEFHPARPRPAPDPGQPPTLALFAGPDREQSRTWEADWLAGEIRRLQDRLNSSETVGVLLFTRRHLAAYLEAWRRAGLNLKVKDGLPLAASPEVQHLHNLATALIRPHDDVAWAALLRGFAGPQPLGRLAAIAGVRGDLWSEKIKGYAVLPHCQPEVRRFSESLEAARRQVGERPLEEILTDWLDRLNAWEQAVAWEAGPQGVANLKAYLDLVAAAAGPNPESTLKQTAALLAKAYQPPDPRAQDSPVEVLTVHAAKGLEYDYVLVPFLDWQPLQTARQDLPFLLEEVPGTGTAVIALNRGFLQAEQSILYQTLKKTAQKNALGEARRLFYVAVTRAKKRLWLSGVVKPDKSGEWKFPPQSPLGWLRQHYRDGALCPGAVNIWQTPILPVSVYDQASAVTRPRQGEEKTAPTWDSPLEVSAGLPTPYEIRSEPWPYDLRFPSQLAEGVKSEAGREDRSGDPLPRVRGEVIHRLLAGLSRGRPLPEPAGVAAALQPAVAPPVDAAELAREILAEVEACREDPFLASLLDPGLPEARSEWLLETWHTDETLYRGQIDLLVCDGQQWWLVDYKTSRPAPGQDWEEFLAAETDKYRPQLLAYREMAAKFFQLPPAAPINLILYFTACRRHVRI